jgi:hypothetical protein
VTLHADSSSPLPGTYEAALNFVAVAEMGRRAIRAWNSRPEAMEPRSAENHNSRRLEEPASVVRGARLSRFRLDLRPLWQLGALASFSLAVDNLSCGQELQRDVDARVDQKLARHGLPVSADFADCAAGRLLSVIDLAMTEYPAAQKTWTHRYWGFYPPVDGQHVPVQAAADVALTELVERRSGLRRRDLEL